jgi:tRNA pseudouridine55 synthase
VTTPSGALLLDKPVGPTSHDMVGAIRKAAQIRRVGHAGTLDPFASGLLLVLVGSATRLAEYFVGMDKTYEATVHLGIETQTHDPEGDVVKEDPGWADVEPRELEAALDSLRGKILQVPPIYSAKKIRGESSHRRVRRGETVELKGVEVEIYDLSVSDIDLPFLRLSVRCSSGTYIRALARDLGRALGVGGHLSALRRTRIGPFTLESATAPEALTRPEQIQAALIPPALALEHLPEVRVGIPEAARLRHGQFLPLSDEVLAKENGPIRVTLDGDLVATATLDDGMLKPRKVLMND